MIRRRVPVLNLFAAVGFLFVVSACATTPGGTSGSSGVEDDGSTPGGMFEPAPLTESEISESPLSSGGLSAMDLQDVAFDYDDSKIRSDSRMVLETTATLLRDNPGVNLQIEGHCDERGTNEYNLALGERRAKAIKEFLVALGVSASRLSTISYGEERSACGEVSENCYSQNRRGHFVIQ